MALRSMNFYESLGLGELAEEVSALQKMAEEHIKSVEGLGGRRRVASGIKIDRVRLDVTRGV